jgi:hypothetical protein
MVMNLLFLQSEHVCFSVVANIIVFVTSSAERLDPREPNWKMLPAMSTGRGCHTVAVLDEKM